MIEKILKAVKSSSKKRGRNITVGAVVGFLLSCTAVMGDDYLWIKNDGSEIKFNIAKTVTTDGGDGNWNEVNPYNANSWDGTTYTNNMALSSYGTNGKGSSNNDINYGLRLSGDLIGKSFINNGSINLSTTGPGDVCGVSNEGSIGELENNASIEVLAMSGNGYGINNEGSIEKLENNASIEVLASGGDNQGINNSGTIKELINNGSIDIKGSGGDGISNSGTIEELINNGSIAGDYDGILNTVRGSIEKLENNGSIAGESGINNNNVNSKIKKLINKGLIRGTATGSNGYGINNETNIEELTNKGLITGTSSGNYGFGIYNMNTIKKLTNEGLVTGTAIGSNNSFGIDGGNIEELTNKGLITGTSSGGNGYGIYGRTIEYLANTGAVYGTTNAIKKEYGTFTNAFNYGILANGGSSSTVDGLDVVNGSVPNADEISNYGLIFNADGGKYISKDVYLNNFGKSTPVTIDGEDYIIINAGGTVDPSSKEITVDSLVLKKGTLTYGDSSTEDFSSNSRYILNGIEDTLVVKEEENKLTKLNNSIVNAYGTAIKVEGDSAYFELNNTTVNGGLDGSSSAILVEGNESFLTIKGDTIVNGEMKSTGNWNTLNLYGKQPVTKTSTNDSMNILNNITGFGRIQIENNVTFFETAKVTGADRININNGGTLNLRLKSGAKLTHALNGNLSSSGNNLLIAGKEEGGSPNAGTLNFITNGVATGIIDMGGIDLENVYLKGSSIISSLEVVKIAGGGADAGDIQLGTGSDLNEIYNNLTNITFDPYPKYNPKSGSKGALPDDIDYDSLDKIYKSSIGKDENTVALMGMIDSSSDEGQWINLLSFLGDIYTQTPYSYSSELSRRSMGMFRDIVTENHFRPDLNKWMIMGGFTHADGGTKDTYYGKNYYNIDSGSSSTKADLKLTGAYALGKYGYSENLSLGIAVGGNRSEAEMSMSKVKGNSGYIGAFAEKYRGNLTLKAGAGIQYSEYDADRRTVGENYSEKYSDMTYDIYLNGRYSHQVGDNLFLEPYGTLSYTYAEQDGANEGGKTLAIETDSKSFDYTVGKVGVDLKKVIPHEKGKSTLSAGVSYTKILDGADEEHITGRFKGGSDFDILVAHKNEHSIGLNAKYALELENGVIFDIKGTYSVERDSHNGSGKNKTKGEWIVGAGLGYKF